MILLQTCALKLTNVLNDLSKTKICKTNIEVLKKAEPSLVNT